MQQTTADSAETQRLLAQVNAGQTRAVDQLFAMHRAELRRFVAARMDVAIAARFDASDVVQETQIEAAKRIRDYLPSQMTSWSD